MFRYPSWFAFSVAMSIAILGVAGCRSRPLMTVMNGNMDVNGKMDMVGDMNMRGDMKMAGEVTTVMKSDNTASRLASVPVYESAHAHVGKRICIIDVDGLMINRNMNGFGSMGENPVALFREKLDFVSTDPSIAAVVLRINSCGGGVTAADIMSRDLQRKVADKRIPVIACVMEVGAGAAYYLACGADWVIVHPTSIVGGIGVILNTYNLEDMMGQFGIVPIPIKQGAMIDMGTPSRVMEEAERQTLQAIADQFHDRFVNRVRARRKSVEVSEAIFDGRVFTGQAALEVGLVDQVGYLDEAIEFAAKMAGLDSEPNIVMLRRDRDRAYSVFDVSPNSPALQSIIPIKVPGLDRSSLPTYLYLWQAEPQPL